MVRLVQARHFPIRRSRLTTRPTGLDFKEFSAYTCSLQNAQAQQASGRSFARWPSMLNSAPLLVAGPVQEGRFAV